MPPPTTHDDRPVKTEVTTIKGYREEQMEIKLVDEEMFPSALEVYTASWRESHRDVCTPEFLENRD